jgi:anaerobic magnesium-protoporphyrin IX monomethyl ester cyclase
MKVLLINPPNTMEEVLGKAHMFVSELDPLGLLYIAAVLEQNNYEVEVLDAFIDHLNLSRILKEIEIRKPDVVGISCLTSNGVAVYEIGKMIKQNFDNIKVVLGNIHASIFSDVYLRDHCADAVVHGEGEHTFLNIVRRYEKKENLSEIKGVSWWNGKQIVNNEPPELIQDLNALPMPARHLVASEKYSIGNLNNFIYVNRGKKELRQMFTSRGCVFSCLFCVVHKKYRTRSPQNVVDEIEHLVQHYNVGYIFIMDSLFIADKKRVVEICKEILRRNINIKWGCEGHINIIDKELLHWMEKAGCYEIHFGIESGVQRLLDNVNKKTKLETIKTQIEMVKRESSIKVAGLFMLGLPGETVEDSKTTIKFATQLPLDFAQFSITVPYPGSKLFDNFVAEGKINSGINADGSCDLNVWKRYSAHTGFSDNAPIYVPKAMTPEELKRMEKLALRRFFLRPRMIVSQMKRIKFSNFYDVLKAFKATFIDS